MIKSRAPDYEYIEEILKNDIDCILEVKKYNPYHGKDGRFTSANGGSGASLSMGVGNYVYEGRREAVSGTLQSIEAKNKDLDHEVATIVDPNSGEALFSVEGSSTGMSLDKYDLMRSRGKIVTHNHPEEVIFSPSDIAFAYNAKAIRATNPSGTVYELANLNDKRAVQAYNNHYMAERAKSFEKLGIDAKSYDRDLTPEQRKSSYEYISKGCHKWLQENAKTYGYLYTKGEI